MTFDQQTGLSDGLVQDFIRDGYVKIENAFSVTLAEQCRNELWTEIGLSPDRPEEWTRPVIRVASMSSAAFLAATNTPQLHRAYDQLAGIGRWAKPLGLGTFPIRFPSAEQTGDDGWHVDTSFGDSADFMEWRVNVKSRGRALLMLFLFSDVGPEEAPTRIRIGSHSIIARELFPHGEAGASLRQLAADSFTSTETCKVTLATGKAGTVFLCHPFLVHAAQANHGTRPRFMAQPPLLPKPDFVGAQPPSAMEIAIEQACGMSFQKNHLDINSY